MTARELGYPRGYFGAVRAASYLPHWLLKRLAKWFDDPNGFMYGPPDTGVAPFMEAHYLRWARHDQRRHADD